MVIQTMPCRKSTFTQSQVVRIRIAAAPVIIAEGEAIADLERQEAVEEVEISAEMMIILKKTKVPSLKDSKLRVSTLELENLEKPCPIPRPC